MKRATKLWINDTIERVAATFVIVLIPTLATTLPWWTGDLVDPSKLGLALGASLGSFAKALGARYIGDSDTAAWLPRRADTPEPAAAEPVTHVAQPVPPAPLSDMTSSTVRSTRIPPPM